MTLYLDTENNIIIKGTNTKASKFLKRNHEEINNIEKILDNFTISFGQLYINLEFLGYTEILTATKWIKDYYEGDIE